MVAEGKKTSPILNGDEGRTDRGTFAKGNPGGRGNPLAKQVNQLRVALAKAVTPADVRGIAKGLIRKAKNGDVAAAHELFDRLLGKAKQAIEVSGGKRPVKMKATFDLGRFLRELDDVERERQAAAGGMVPPHRN